MGFFRKRNAKLAEIRSDERRRSKSAHFAIISFILDVVSVGVLFGGMYLFLYGVTPDAWGTLLVFALLPLGLGVGLMIGALILLFWSLVMVITQFCINRSVWSWIALVLLIATAAGIVFLAYTVLSQAKV